jgi:hypothetical protein
VGSARRRKGRDGGNLNQKSLCPAAFRTAHLSIVNLEHYLYTNPPDDDIKIHIVACLLKARIVKPAETAVLTELLCKYARCQALAQ